MAAKTPRLYQSRHAGSLHHIDLGPAFANVQETAWALLTDHAADQEKPQSKKYQRRQYPRHHIAQPGVVDHPCVGDWVKARCWNVHVS